MLALPGEWSMFFQSWTEADPVPGGTWRNGIDYCRENISDPNAGIGEAIELLKFLTTSP